MKWMLNLISHKLFLLYLMGESYDIWKVKMKSYMESFDLWDVIEEDYEVFSMPKNLTMVQIKHHKERKKSRRRRQRHAYLLVFPS